MIEVLNNNFYFMRHGETNYNLRGVLTGGVDVPLNQTGLLQAKNAYKIVKNLNYKSCVTSTQKRAIQTAQLATGNFEGILTLKGLEERYFGDLEGRDKKLLSDADFTDSGIEPWEVFINRIVDTLRGLSLPTPILIVAHSGTYRALCQYLNLIIEKKPVANALPYRFYKEGKWQVELLTN